MDVIMVQHGIAGFQAHLRSLCTWGALLLAAVAALGSLVRAISMAVPKRLRLHGRRVTAAKGCGGGGMVAAPAVPEPFSVDFSDDDGEERSCSTSCSWSNELLRQGYKRRQEEQEDDVDEGHRLGCCTDDEQHEPADARKVSQDQQHLEHWGFGVGDWDSWLSCSRGNVVKAWEQQHRGHTDAAKGFFRETSGGGAAFSGFAPLMIRPFSLLPPTLTLTCSNGLDLQLWDSRLRTRDRPAAVIPGPAAPTLRRRPSAGFDGDNHKVVYVADFRNAKGVFLRRVDGDEYTW